MGKRIDVILSEKIQNLSRNRIQNLITKNFVKFDGKIIDDRSFLVKSIGKVDITIPEIKSSSISPQKINLNIIFEDEDLLVLNKNAGIVVHPGAGNYENTLVNGLIYYCKNSLSGIGGILRPGIVHRIDKMTSGLLVVAKNDFTHNNLANQFSKRTIKRMYGCLTWNKTNLTNGKVTTNICRSKVNRKKMVVCDENKGKTAVTNYNLKKEYNFKNISICHYECILETGRTHQIRVHMSHLGAPLIGDSIYKKNLNIKNIPCEINKHVNKFFVKPKRQALHAISLGFIHPKSKEKLFFKSEYPEDFVKMVKILEKAKKT